MIYGFFYLIACLVIASTGINKKIGYFGTLIISLLLSPVIGLIVALVSKEKNPVERFREIAIKSKNKQDYIIAIRNIQKALSIEPSNPKLVYDLACYYSVIGNKVDAINALIRAVELGYSNFPQIDCDPDLSNIR
ncbi:MAG: hypothetical protein HY738_13165, partial [Bacteroidia bacterium]|nr:hypothetical protein [Bacteroidia bacterium]